MASWKHEKHKRKRGECKHRNMVVLRDNTEMELTTRNGFRTPYRVSPVQKPQGLMSKEEFELLLSNFRLAHRHDFPPEQFHATPLEPQYLLPAMGGSA